MTPPYLPLEKPSFCGTELCEKSEFTEEEEEEEEKVAELCEKSEFTEEEEEEEKVAAPPFFGWSLVVFEKKKKEE